MNRVRKSRTAYARYYRIVYADKKCGASRRICICRAPSLEEAKKIARVHAPKIGLKEVMVAPITKDQVKHEYAWLNFKERVW